MQTVSEETCLHYCLASLTVSIPKRFFSLPYTPASRAAWLKISSTSGPALGALCLIGFVFPIAAVTVVVMQRIASTVEACSAAAANSNSTGLAKASLNPVGRCRCRRRLLGHCSLSLGYCGLSGGNCCFPCCQVLGPILELHRLLLLAALAHVCNLLQHRLHHCLIGGGHATVCHGCSTSSLLRHGVARQELSRSTQTGVSKRLLRQVMDSAACSQRQCKASHQALSQRALTNQTQSSCPRSSRKSFIFAS